MTDVKLLVLPIAALLLPGVARAHHSIGKTYDVSKDMTIKGTIVQVSLRSPHSFFLIEANDAGGQAQRWSIEAAAVLQFARQGVAKDTFKAGDSVEVLCNPAREAGYRGRLIKITRITDGASALFDLNSESVGPDIGTGARGKH